MSDADRDKWNQRYAQGAYQGRSSASAWLMTWLSEAPAGRALDVACGLGRNARYLARLGYDVDAIDISKEGLRRAARLADGEGLEIRWIERDLELGLADGIGGYQVITLFRYVNARLLSTLSSRLSPGGCLVVEEHLLVEDEVAGPVNPKFRVAAGELERAAAGLQILAVEESVVTDPDGRRVALAQLVARKGP